LGTVVISNGGLSNTGTLTVSVGTFTYSLGAFSNTGTLNVDTDISFPSGAITNAGTINVGIGKTLAVTGNLTNNGNLTANGTLTVSADTANTGTLTLNGASTLTGAVNNDETLVVNVDTSFGAAVTNTGGTITVADTKTLTVTGGITNAAGNGEISGEGTVIISAVGLTNNGTLTVGATVNINGGDLLNNNTDSALTVAQGGTIALGGSAGNITNTKTIIIAGTLSSANSGATNTTSGLINVTSGNLTTAVGVTVSGEAITATGENSTVSINGNALVGTAAFQLGANGSFSYDGADYTLGGAVSVNSSYTLPVSFLLAATGVLTIANDVTLDIGSNSISGAEGSQIVIPEVGGGGINPGEITINTSNFYDTTKTQDTSIDAAATYVWDLDADGSSGAGWLEQS
jgi:hypothetical protein